MDCTLYPLPIGKISPEPAHHPGKPHKCSVPSIDAEASIAPSAEKATLHTELVC